MATRKPTCVAAGCGQPRVAHSLADGDTLYCGVHAASAAVAEALGCSLVHVNRWVAERARGLRVVIYRA
jgi:hypothetical protein